MWFSKSISVYVRFSSKILCFSWVVLFWKAPKNRQSVKKLCGNSNRVSITGFNFYFYG